MRVGVSVRRNQMIVQHLVELRLVDALGRGIVLLVEEAATLGLPEPTIDVPPGFTRVVLHFPLAA
jgi:predicted HTH transcriptional regulator